MIGKFKYLFKEQSYSRGSLLRLALFISFKGVISRGGVLSLVFCVVFCVSTVVAFLFVFHPVHPNSTCYNIALKFSWASSTKACVKAAHSCYNIYYPHLQSSHSAEAFPLGSSLITTHLTVSKPQGDQLTLAAQQCWNYCKKKWAAAGVISHYCGFIADTYWLHYSDKSGV